MVGVVIAASGSGRRGRRKDRLAPWQAYAALVASGGAARRCSRARSSGTSPSPIIPSVLLALTVGLSLVRGLSGVDASLSIAIPFAGLALVGGLALGAALLVVGVGLLFLRSSTSLEELRTG